MTKIIPPFAGVVLVECHDRLELTPIYAYREFIGLGKYKSSEVGPQPGDPMHPFFNAIMKGKKIWVIACWHQYDDGREEDFRVHYLDPLATEKEARKVFEDEVEFTNLSKKELEELGTLFKQTDDDIAYVENRFPNIISPPPADAPIEERDLYNARLKTFAGFQPNTVALLQKADAATDPSARRALEQEAVDAFFADLAHYFSDETIKSWERSNPIGPKWLCAFARVRESPKRRLDDVNHELVLNWLRKNYNMFTAEELSDIIWKATGKRLSPGTIKKRRERLGLTARPPGPRPNPEVV